MKNDMQNVGHSVELRIKKSDSTFTNLNICCNMEVIKEM